jgi:hypothetical protein
MGPRSLRCVDFDALVPEALEGVLGAGPRRAFAAHERACAACRADLAAYRALPALARSAFEDARAAELDESLVARITSAARRARLPHG